MKTIKANTIVIIGFLVGMFVLCKQIPSIRTNKYLKSKEKLIIEKRKEIVRLKNKQKALCKEVEAEMKWFFVSIEEMQKRNDQLQQEIKRLVQETKEENYKVLPILNEIKAENKSYYDEVIEPDLKKMKKQYSLFGIIGIEDTKGIKEKIPEWEKGCAERLAPFYKRLEVALKEDLQHSLDRRSRYLNYLNEITGIML